MLNLNTNKNKVILAGTMSVVFVLILYFFINPQSAHAEKIYEVLKGTEGPSALIKEVWNKVIALINYTGMAMLIFIAFANILRLDLNTYGIKKFLPSFIFAIVMANFSYILIRAVVDLASVASDALINSPHGAGIDAPASEFGIAKAFSFKLNGGDLVANGALNWARLGGVLLLTLLQFIGTVMILILTFLFIARQYMIYFLAAIGPFAFMCAVLPFTKTVWNMWWQNLWKWAFMPVVSLFWLWLGSQWIEPMTTGYQNVSVIGILFAGICFYLAITNPMKMGQGVMTAWNKVGKWGWGKTGGKGVDYMKAKGQATWNSRSQNAQNWFREKTGIGNGLVAAQKAEERAKKYKGGLDDQATGKYIGRLGARGANAQARLMSMEGSTEYNEKEQLALLTENKKYKKALEERRFNSMLGGANLEIFDGKWNQFNDTQTKNIHEERDAHGKELIIYKVGEDGNKILDDNGNPIVDESKSDVAESEKRKLWKEEYKNSVWKSEETKMEAEKRKVDTVDQGIEERQSIDNVVTEQKITKKMLAALQDIDRLLALQDIRELNGEEKEDLSMASNTVEGAGYEVGSAGDKERIIERNKLAEENYLRVAQPLIDKATNNERIGAHLQDLVTKDKDGNYTIEERSGIEKSRMGIRMNRKINEGAATVTERFSEAEVTHILNHGSETEGFNKQDVADFWAGKKNPNADKQRKIAEFARAQTGFMSSNIHGDSATTNVVNSMASNNVNALRDAAHAMNKGYRNSNPNPKKEEVTDLIDLNDSRFQGENAAENLSAEIKQIYHGTHTGLKAAMERDYRLTATNDAPTAQNRRKSQGKNLAGLAFQDSTLFGGRGGSAKTL